MSFSSQLRVSSDVAKLHDRFEWNEARNRRSTFLPGYDEEYDLSERNRFEKLSKLSLNFVNFNILEKALTLGTLFTTDEALKVGLIDEIAQDKTECLLKCEKFLLKFKNISPIAREYSKLVKIAQFAN